MRLATTMQGAHGHSDLQAVQPNFTMEQANIKCSRLTRISLIGGYDFPQPKDPHSTRNEQGWIFLSLESELIAQTQSPDMSTDQNETQHPPRLLHSSSMPQHLLSNWINSSRIIVPISTVLQWVTVSLLEFFINDLFNDLARLFRLRRKPLGRIRHAPIIPEVDGSCQKLSRGHPPPIKTNGMNYCQMKVYTPEPRSFLPFSTVSFICQSISFLQSSVKRGSMRTFHDPVKQPPFVSLPSLRRF